MLLYDFFLLLPDEVRLIWERPNKFSVTVILYLMNRYVWLFATPFAVATKFTPLHANVSAAWIAS